MSALFDLLVRVRMGRIGLFLWRPFLRQTHDPARAQARLLSRILRRNKDTTFGRKNGFANIDTLEAYAAGVPIRNYEDLRPSIESQEERKTPELLAEQPIMYAQTSGTTGQPKYIPITPSSIKRYRRSQQLFSYSQYHAVKGIYGGKILAFVSPAIETHLPSGTPCGSMSGLIYESMPRLLRRKYLVPPAVFACPDYELKYLLIAIYALAETNISYIACANPSTLLKIAEVIRVNHVAIIAALETGEIPGNDQLDKKTTDLLQMDFPKNPKRAAELRTLLVGKDQLNFALLWPTLKAVSCWREGSGRVLLSALDELLSAKIPVLEVGYLSSEFRGSLPVDIYGRLEVAAIHENYFEFIAREDWESGRKNVLTIDQLKLGGAYYVVVTTQTGLYRYFMDDIIVVDGSFNRTPTIKFLEKGSGSTSITGEKLYESQVSAAVSEVLRKRKITAHFFIFVAEAVQQRYRFFLEAKGGDYHGLAADIDRAIAALNMEYKSKRDSGRLHPVALTLVEAGTGDAYKSHLVSQGQREAQFKFRRLQSQEKLDYNFDQHEINTS